MAHKEYQLLINSIIRHCPTLYKIFQCLPMDYVIQSLQTKYHKLTIQELKEFESVLKLEFKNTVLT